MSDLSDNAGRDLIYVLEDIREQLKLSNRIALAVFLTNRFGAYAPALFEGTENKNGLDLLKHNPDMNGNIRLADEVRSLLGLPLDESENSG